MNSLSFFLLLLLKCIILILYFQISKFLKLIVNMYDKSNTPEKILNFQKTNDLKMLISQIRVTTTITKNSINVSIID